MRVVKILAAIVGVVVLVVVGVLVYASTIDFNQYKPLIVAKAKEATGRDLEMKGALKLAIGLRPAVAVDGVSFQNAAGGEKRPMMSFERFEAQVALLPLLTSFGKNIVVDRIVLKGADVLLETDAQGKGNWEFQPAAAPSQPASPSAGGPGALPVINVLELRDVKLTYRDGKEKKTTSLALEKALLETDGSTLKLEVAGIYNKLAFAVNGRTGRLIDLMGIGGSGAFPVDVSLALGDRVKATVKGRIAQPQQGKGIDLAFAADIPDAAKLADVAADAGTVAAVPLSGPIKLAARITDPAPDRYALSDIKFEGAGSDLAGQMQYAKLANDRQSITGDFRSNRIDLAKLMAGDGKKPAAGSTPARGGAPAQRSDRVFSDDPLPLDAMKATDADVKLAIAELVLPNAMVAKTVQVALVIRNGDLTVEPLKTVFGGAPIDGDVKLAQSGALTAKLKAAGLDLGQLVKEASGADNLTGGKTDFDLDVRSSGKSVRQLMAGMNGRVAVTVGQGAIKSAYVDRFGVEDLMAIINKALPREDSIRLNCVVSRIDIASGVATHRTLVVDTARITANGDGRVNLGSEQIDMRLDTKTKVTSLLSALPPILVKGTLANPSYQPDVLGAAAGIAGAVVNAPGGAAGGIGGLAGGIAGAVTGQRPAQQQASSGGDPCATALGRAQPASSTPASQPAQQAPAQQAPAQQQPSGGGGLIPGGLPNPFRR